MPSIKVSIDEDGNISMDYVGFIGNSCEKAEDAIKKKLDQLRLEKQSDHTKKEHHDSMYEVERY